MSLTNEIAILDTLRDIKLELQETQKEARKSKQILKEILEELKQVKIR